MKKRVLLLLIGTSFLLLSVSCMSLFSALSVDPPTDASSSMIAVEIASNDSYLVNNNFTGWAPIVKDANGTILPFRMINALAGGATLYVLENVKPGTYTFSAMRHVYTDYSLLPDDLIPSYEPYVSSPYHINQEFELPKKVVLSVEPGEIASLGYYDISYEWNGGGFAEKDDRWAVVPSTVAIHAEPESTRPLELIRGSLNSTNWVPWNERNPVK